MELTKVHKLLIQGVVSRDREIQRMFVEPLKKDFSDVIELIEGDLGLEKGDIGKKYQLNLDNLTINEIPKKEEVKE